MSDHDRLLRWYRLLLACYPASFRRAQTEEILAVLLDTATPGRSRPTVAESFDLLRGAVRMRSRIRAQQDRAARPVTWLMAAGAVLESVAVVIVWTTRDRVLTAVRAADHHISGAEVTGLATGLTATLVAGGVAVGLWAVLAWIYPRRSSGAAVVLAVFFFASLANVLRALAAGAAHYRAFSPDLLIGTALVLLELLALTWIATSRLRTDHTTRISTTA